MNSAKRAARIKELESKLAVISNKQARLLSKEGMIRCELQHLYGERRHEGMRQKRYSFK
jgi:hypothetical protein